MKRLLAAGGFLGFMAVALGAFGAHGLKGHLPADAMDIYQTGVQYHMFHALAIILAALLAERWAEGAGGRNALRAGWFFAAGTILFSGSLYALAFSGIHMLGAVTPLGGVSFLIGWFLMAAAGLRR